MWSAVSDERTGLPFESLSPAGLVTVLLSHILDSPNMEDQVPVFIPPPKQGGPVIHPGTGPPLRRLLRLAGLRWRYSSPPPRGVTCRILSCQLSCQDNFSARTTSKSPALYCCARVRFRRNAFTDPLLRNGLHNPMFYR
jgi:hypothetical protein